MILWLWWNAAYTVASLASGVCDFYLLEVLNVYVPIYIYKVMQMKNEIVSLEIHYLYTILHHFRLFIKWKTA